MRKKYASTLSTLLKIDNGLFPVAALLGIVLFSLAPNLLSPTAQLYVLGGVIAVLGLPHGALDPWVAEHLGLSKTRTQRVIFDFCYLVLAAAVVLIWLWLPALCLAVFLIISAWHFSDDWKHTVNQPLRLCVGTVLLLLPIGFHADTVGQIFTQLSGLQGEHLAQTVAFAPWILIVAMLTLAGIAASMRQWRTSIEWLSLLGLAYYTAPLVYFTIYFCFLHSPRHLLSVFAQAPSTEHTRLLQMLVVYTLATFVLLSGLWWWWSTLPLSTIILKIIFIGLAAVTVPHMLLMACVKLKRRQNLSSI